MPGFEGIKTAKEVLGSVPGELSMSSTPDTGTNSSVPSVSSQLNAPSPAIAGYNASAPSTKSMVTEQQADLGPIKEDAYNEVNDFEQQMQNRSPESLNAVQNTNIAKDGRYGNLNNKSFNDTLNLSRQADAYNNRPDTVLFATNPDNGIAQEIHKVPKKEIETQEMRQMRANERLDEKQRGTDVDLQAAVNAKDLEAFKMAWKQKYNIQLTDYQARQEMVNFAQQERVKLLLDKDKAYFNQQLAWAFGMKKAKWLMQAAESGDRVALGITAQLTGLTPPDQSDLAVREKEMQLTQIYQANGMDAATAAYQARQDITKLSRSAYDGVKW